MAAGTGTQKELRVQIVDFQPGDLPAVRALELECFSDAWSEKLLQDLLTSSWDKTWVLKEDETVCGYSNFRVIAGEGELMRIAVHGACRGRGYGRLLMERLLREAEEENVEDKSAIANGQRAGHIREQPNAINGTGGYRKTN